MSGHRVTAEFQKPQEPAFVGTTVAPEVCPRARCGQPVGVTFPNDRLAPGMWHCPAGHGGVLNQKPETFTAGPPKPEKGKCRRCGEPVPEKRARGGYRGHFCTECIEMVHREWKEGAKR